MSRKHRKRGGGDESDVDLTPMLDIVFIMLIFFIVTATFVHEKGFDVTSPPPDKEDTSVNKPAILILVDAHNNVFFKDRPVDVRAVRANVARELAEFPDSPVLVQADKKSDMGVVVRVMDQAKLARKPPPPVAIATQGG